MARGRERARRLVSVGPAQTIDEVVGRLTEIVERSRAERSRLGYFAALYRKVTVKVRDGISDGFFRDGPRMERLDVIFANRYLNAYDAHRSGAPTSNAWAFAFRAADHRGPIVLQHLLLGMNAHINLDLGIAAARTVQAHELPDLHGDFNKINQILSGLVGEVQTELAQIWLFLRVLNRYLGSVEKGIINFSMEKARDHAWSVAERLAPLDESARAAEIRTLDASMALFARTIRHPGPLAGTITRLVRVGERGSVERKIRILE